MLNDKELKAGENSPASSKAGETPAINDNNSASAVVDEQVKKLTEELDEANAKLLSNADEMKEAYEVIADLKRKLNDKSRAAKGKLPSVEIDGEAFEFKLPKFNFNGSVYSAEEASGNLELLRQLRDETGVLVPLRDRKKD